MSSPINIDEIKPGDYVKLWDMDYICLILKRFRHPSSEETATDTFLVKRDEPWEGKGTCSSDYKCPCSYICKQDPHLGCRHSFEKKINVLKGILACGTYEANIKKYGIKGDK